VGAKKVKEKVKLPPGYKTDWAGEYESQKRSSRQLMLVLPVTVLLIFLLLYIMFHSGKWATLILVNVSMAPLGGLVALFLTHTNFSVSSGVGFLALFGVSVQVGVIMLEYINQMRVRGHSSTTAGQITGIVGNMRRLQFAVRMNF
jgi:cobalt-zinc-cadmium resistance protein CzcA